MIGNNSLANLAKIRKDVKRKRVSSYDVKGANIDTAVIEANQKYEVCNINSAGCIKHIWMTLASSITDFLRRVIIRMWWDGEEHPSVEVPIGDFYGVGHAQTGAQQQRWPSLFHPRQVNRRSRHVLHHFSGTVADCPADADGFLQRELRHRGVDSNRPNGAGLLRLPGGLLHGRHADVRTDPQQLRQLSALSFRVGPECSDCAEDSRRGGGADQPSAFDRPDRSRAGFDNP